VILGIFVLYHYFY